tara:strand:- start:100 stop:309 length:210 start_codon:yes stop_codon:yes gene_type:complete
LVIYTFGFILGWRETLENLQNPTWPTRLSITNNLVIEIPRQEVSFLSAFMEDPKAKGSRLFGSTPLIPL